MIKIKFKQSSKLVTEYENSVYNTHTGALKAMAVKMKQAEGRLQRLQNMTARKWASYVQESVHRQIMGGHWRKRPKALSARYLARKQRTPGLDTGILKAVKPHGLVTGLSAQFPGGGKAVITYVGDASSPFNQTRSSEPRITRTGAIRSKSELKKWTGSRKTGFKKSTMLLAELATLMEFGSRGKGGIPKRPYFAPALEYASLNVSREVGDDVYAALFGGERQMAAITKRIRRQLANA